MAIHFHAATSFIYKAPFDNGLTEHELDHIMLGNYCGAPVINQDEVACVRSVTKPISSFNLLVPA